MKKSTLMKSLLVLVTSSILLSCFLPIGYSNKVGIFDGMYVDHIYTVSRMSGVEVDMTLTFTRPSEDTVHIVNKLKSPINDIGSWDVNTSTRIISNVQNFGPFSGNHSVFWIYTDISLTDQFPMCNIWRCVHGFDGDVLFTVTDEAKHGSMAIWQLEDAYGSVLWYEKTRGFLVNGTINHNEDWNSYEFVSTNALDSGDAAIPGYSYFLLIGIIAGVSFILIRKQKIKK
ncbi:MAG: hypothetical protein ACFE91_00650 [Promethearchaeota archaeon]